VAFWSDKKWKAIAKKTDLIQPFDVNRIEAANYRLAIGDEIYVSEPDGFSQQAVLVRISSVVHSSSVMASAGPIKNRQAAAIRRSPFIETPSVRDTIRPRQNARVFNNAGSVRKFLAWSALVFDEGTHLSTFNYGVHHIPSSRRKSGPRLSACSLVASLGPGVRRYRVHTSP
jgi:hypothetical protein